MKPILAHLGLVTVGTESAWAVTSPDNVYRYVLGRMWDSFCDHGEECWEREPVRPLWVYGMLNPSDARVDDDPTVRKCIGFAKRGGAGGLLVVNMSAYSTPYPRRLVAVARQGVDVCGPHNDAAVRWATSRRARGRNIAAWGKIPPTLRSLARRGIGEFLIHRAYCFGFNGDGTPRHPLRLAYETLMIPYAKAA